MENYDAEIQRLNESIVNIFRNEKDLIEHVNAIIEQLSINRAESQRALIYAQNLKYELNDPRNQFCSHYFYPDIRSSDETLNELIYNRRSIARFGDGEFSIIFNHQRQPFQNYDSNLANRLFNIIQDTSDRILIAIADNYGSLDRYNEESANGIRMYMSDETRSEHASVLNPDITYYNAYVTRPYIIYADNHTDAPRRRFERWKQLWNNRNIVIVEGSQSRLGVGNDLFCNCNSIRRILAPATNSYSRYDDLLNATLTNVSTDDIILIALGPCAGVLAYDLACEGFQAIDIGHLDLEYEWFLAGKGVRVPVPHKYNNEYPGDETAQPIYDTAYESQIIARFD